MNKPLLLINRNFTDFAESAMKRYEPINGIYPSFRSQILYSLKVIRMGERWIFVNGSLFKEGWGSREFFFKRLKGYNDLYFSYNPITEREVLLFASCIPRLYSHWKLGFKIDFQGLWY